MKTLRKYFLPLALLFSLGCSEDDINPSIEAYDIVQYDLHQITNAAPNFIAEVKASGTDLNKISVIVTKDGASEEVASNTVTKITSNSLNRVRIPVPFPDKSEAPSGLYKVNYRIEFDGGNSTETSYNVHIINNKMQAASPCVFPNLPLPEGKNVWVQMTAPATTGNDEVYVVGNFMVANGAEGDWNPGNPAFKMTRVPNTNCYYIALNLVSGDQVKFTRGEWSKVMKDENGADYRNGNDPRPGHNGDGNILYGTNPYDVGSTLKFTVFNWADNVVPAPADIPAAAIKSGHTTVIARFGSVDGSDKYYLVKENATNLTGAIEMVRLTGTNRFAGAVPKVSNENYIVVKGAIEKKGINSFDVVKTITLDEISNPIDVNIPGFRGEMQVTPVPSNLFIVGGATPGGWGNPVPVPSQQFTKAGNAFTITIQLTAGQEYLLLPVNGSWDAKFGMGGTALVGDLIPGGANFAAPSESGNYKITADFSTGLYTLVKM